MWVYHDIEDGSEKSRWDCEETKYRHLGKVLKLKSMKGTHLDVKNFYRTQFQVLRALRAAVWKKISHDVLT